MFSGERPGGGLVLRVAAGASAAAGAPPIILSIGPAPERTNRVTSAAAASRKMMLRMVV